MQRNASHRTTVLIVEDEILLRMDATEALESAGLVVVEAGSADEAILILEQRDDINLIFTDIHMPGSMDGLKLAHFVKDRWPPIRIIATSGHSKIDEDGFARWQSLYSQTVYGGRSRPSHSPANFMTELDDCTQEIVGPHLRDWRFPGCLKTFNIPDCRRRTASMPIRSQASGT